MEATAAPLPVEQVYATLQAALSYEQAVRSAAEGQLRDWESVAAPGFIGSLLKVVAETQAVPEEGRLMAAVIAKNAVGSSWRKTVGSREWSRVPEEEKAYARSTALASLLQDPSERVAAQVALLIGNIAQFDFPGRWPALLGDLASAAELAALTPLPAKRRALRALKHVLRALQGKRFVVEAPQGSSIGSLSPQELKALVASSDAQRTQMATELKALLPRLRSQWEAHAQALLRQEQQQQAAAGEGWEAGGMLGAATLSALRELLLLLPELKGEEEEPAAAFFTEAQQAAAAIAPQLFSPGTEIASGDDSLSAAAAAAAGPAVLRRLLLSKQWERLLQCVVVAMDRNPLLFAAFLPAWISLCINTALMGMDAAAVHHIRSKGRVLLTRFCARAFLQPYYRAEYAEGEAPDAIYMSSVGRQRLQEKMPALQAAASTLNSLLSDAQCPALVQALVQKYIAISPEELAEWQANPEGFARNIDVETSPDADTTRPCGVAMLECMLERSDEPVANALVAMAQQLQVQALDEGSLLMREATYRAIGECFQHLRAKVNFPAWYDSELRLMLLSTELYGLHGAILRARALWLVGVCGSELQPPPWAEAFGLAVQHISHSDLVVALMGVSAVTALLGSALEEQSFVSQPAQRQLMMMGGYINLVAPEEQDEDVSAASAEFNAHLVAVDSHTDALMAACFALLPRLGETESMVRVLHCVSATVELMGDRVRPHLPSITSALPQVWSVISQRAGGGETGALARLHSALIAVVTHLVRRLGTSAMGDPHVAGLLFPLLTHATNPGSPEAESLLEDGLRLWLAVLHSSAELAPQLQELLLQRLPHILRRGQETASCMRIAEGHAILGGLEAVAALLPQLATAAGGSLRGVVEDLQQRHAAAEAAMAAAAEGRRAPPQPSGPALTAERQEEAAAAASLLVHLMQLHAAAGAGGAALPGELQGAAAAAAAVAATDFGLGPLRLPARASGLVEACLEVVSRVVFQEPATLSALVGGNEEMETRLLDRWITLSTARDIAEMFVPSAGVIGRVRRHNAAVALCALLYADSSAPLRVPERAAQALAVGLRAAREAEDYTADKAQQVPASVGREDGLLAARLALARRDPLRAVGADAATRAAAGKVAAREGEAAMLERLNGVQPEWRKLMQALLSGQPLRPPQEEQRRQQQLMMMGM